VTAPLLIGVALGFLAAMPLLYLAVHRTRRRVARLQEQNHANQRLAELGTLAGGLAHEIKNPLSSVNLNIQLLQEDLQQVADGYRAGRLDGDEHEQQVARIQRRFGSLASETRRLRDILEDFLRFAGRLKLQREPTDLNALVDQVADFFAAQAQAAAIHIRTTLAARPAVAHVDGDLLKQALLNLMINAVHAMTAAREKSRPHGGADELLLRTQLRRVPGGSEIEIHVTDTGPGIDAAILPRLFEPYFSTRRGGTGLGLPTARRIVEEHGGRITVHTEPGRGSDFAIILPAAAPNPPTNPPTDPPTTSAASHASALESPGS
jgi:signal transduction histidine kinase